jgi:hypothetical protein
VIAIAPSNATDVVAVAGTASLSGTVLFEPGPGFYAFGETYTFLTSAGLGGTEFSSFSFSNPNFSGTISYTNNAILNVKIAEPLLGFPFINDNTRRVGENIDALNVKG